YPFEGRLAHQTLGMLLTRRLERARARPLGFVANEYALAIWGVGDMSFMVRHGKLDLDALFNPDMLGDDLEAWLAESALMKRTFRRWRCPSCWKSAASRSMAKQPTSCWRKPPTNSSKRRWNRP